MLTLVALAFASAAVAQKVGTDTEETHPKLTWQRCTGSGCTDVAGEVVIDHNWRWVHNEEFQNCYDGNVWTDVCSTNEECAEVCQLDGARYEETYGVTSSGNELDLRFVTEHEYGTNVGSRMYLMENEDTYQMFDLIGNEFTFDVDLSTVACGLNSALYFVAMEADGGMGSFPSNEAGAKYGTGYCDAQCARDLKFIGGMGNVEDWEASSGDENAGIGRLGSCCGEIDVWESNAHSFALTPHGCENNAYHVCDADVEPGCGGTYSEDRFAGLCDANGCDYNPYRMGNTDFYGEGKTVDTSSVFTVVTQFTAESITQFFVQGGERIDIPTPTWEGLPDSSSVDAGLCDVLFDVFDDYDRYSEVGGWSAISDALSQPQVLVLSIWADFYANMLWLDGVWPADEDASDPGNTRGDCAADSGVPAEVIEGNPEAHVTWSNIRFGPIGSTVDV